MKYLISIPANEEGLTPSPEELHDAILDGLANKDFLPLPAYVAIRPYRDPLVEAARSTEALNES